MSDRAEIHAPPVLVDRPRERVARITLNRAERRNAQDVDLLYALNQAFDEAAAATDVRVIILAANGPHFSSGHDLTQGDPAVAMAAHQPVGTWTDFTAEGACGRLDREHELYFELCERWRNLPKPTIAAVQGAVIAGGLLLVWPCDLVIAAESAVFSDNTVAMGVSGAEFFHHPWEMGARKAKEMLFTQAGITAADAHRLGMVNHVVPLAELEVFTLDLASQIAKSPVMALRLAKLAVNAAQDAQGRRSALETAFAYHQLCHSHNVLVHGRPIDPAFMERWQTRRVRGGSE